MTARRYANLAVTNGISVVPPRDNGTKRPIGAWKEYQHRLPTDDELDRWYTNPHTGIGVITGHISGNLEMLEFEGRAIRDGLYADWAELIHAAGLADLWQRIEDGYWERTPTGGYHFLYRAEHIEGNTRLAANEQGEVLIETRGEGGYVITAPTQGTVHPTGKPWELLAGGFHNIPTITRTERAAIHRTARALDRSPTRTLAEPKDHWDNTDSGRPGDLYNQHPDTPARTLKLLLDHGWKLNFTDRQGVHHLTRPGKDPKEGTSATLGSPKVGGGFYVFSTSAHPFEAERGYDHYAVYTTLQHQGDWTAAARNLADQGFATPNPDIELKLPDSQTQTIPHGDNPFVDWNTIWDLEPDELLIEPMFLEGRGHAIYAKAKTGKSLLTLALVAEAAIRDENLRVLYLDYEMGMQDLAMRLEKMGYGKHTPLDRIYYAMFPPIPPLDTEAGGLALMEYAAIAMADAPEGTRLLVIIDTISRAVEGEENSADTYRAFYRHTGMRLKAAGYTWARIDHAGKDQKLGQRGSSAKNDDVDVVWEIVRPDKNDDSHIVVSCTFQRVGFLPKSITMTQRENPLGFEFRKGAIVTPHTMEVARRIHRDYGIQPGIAQNQAADQVQQAMRDAGIGEGDDGWLTRTEIKLAAKAMKDFPGGQWLQSKRDPDQSGPEESEIDPF